MEEIDKNNKVIAYYKGLYLTDDTALKIDDYTEIPEFIVCIRKKTISQYSTTLANEIAKLPPLGPIFAISPDTAFSIPCTIRLAVYNLADMYPMLKKEEIEMIKGGIKICQPIIMQNGVFLDGQNKLWTCKEWEIKTKMTNCNVTQTEELIIIMNLHPCPATCGQLAALAVKILPLLEQQTAKGKSAGATDSKNRIDRLADIAGSMVGIRKKDVIAAKKIAESSDDIYQDLLNGILTLPYAKYWAGMDELAKIPSMPQGNSLPERIYRMLLEQKNAGGSLKALVAIPPVIKSRPMRRKPGCPRVPWPRRGNRLSRN